MSRGICPVLGAYAKALTGKAWPPLDGFQVELGATLAALGGTARSAATERARACFIAARHIVVCSHGCDLTERLAETAIDGAKAAWASDVRAAADRAQRAYGATLRDHEDTGMEQVLPDDATDEARATWEAEGRALAEAYQLQAEAFLATVFAVGMEPAEVATCCAEYLDDDDEDSQVAWGLDTLRQAFAVGPDGRVLLPLESPPAPAVTPQAVMAFLGAPRTPMEALARFFDRVVAPCAPEAFPPPGTPVEVRIETGRFRGAILRSYLGESGLPLVGVELEGGREVWQAQQDAQLSRHNTWRHVARPTEGVRLVPKGRT